MYKLTILTGPKRGTSFSLTEGEMTLGRQAGNAIVLPSSKVSKNHCSLILENGSVTVKDLGSSNGTFVNGILTKLRKIKPGDRVSVGEFVLELVEVSQRVAPAVSGGPSLMSQPSGQSGLQFPQGMGWSNPNLPAPGALPSGVGHASVESAPPAPKSLKDKVVWYFENQLMPFFYNLNQKHEWNILCVGFLAAFVLGNLVISVQPLMEANHQSLLKECSRRAKFMARQIAEQNAGYLAARAETKTDLGIVETAEGVRTAVLVDLDNRIIAPGTKLNQYFTGGTEAAAAVRARDLFRNGRETGVVTETSDLVIAIEPVKVLNASLGRNVVVGMAVVSLDTTLSTPELGETGMVYSETLILTAFLGGILFLILYRVTLRPFQVLNEDMDKALKGELTQVTHEFKLKELDPLWEIINSAIQRIPRSDSSINRSGDGGSDGGAGAEEFLGPLRTLGQVAKVGIIAFSADKKIVYLNPLFEEMSGIRADGAIGVEISEVARDQSLGHFTNDILGRTTGGGDGLSEDYDFSGINYHIHAMAFGPASGPVRCYLMVAVRAET